MRRRFALLVALALTVLLAAAPPVAAGHRFPRQIDLPDGWQPEGITAGRGTTVYVGSLADGSIWKGNVRTGKGKSFITGPGAGHPAVGVEYDRRNDRLWVAGGPSCEIRAYKASTGRHLRTWTITPCGFLNDLVVTRKAVYVTDSGIQELKVIPLRRHGKLPASNAGRTLPLTGDIAFVPNEFNLNGIVARGGWLIGVQSNTGQLFRISPKTGFAREIDLDGESVSFGDGLELRGRTLYVVRNELNSVSVLRLSRSLRSADKLGDLTSDKLDIPTTAAIQAGRLWVVNARFGTPPTPDTEYWITRLPLRP